MTDIVKWSAEIQGFMYSDMDFPGGLNKKQKADALLCLPSGFKRRDFVIHLFSAVLESDVPERLHRQP